MPKSRFDKLGNLHNEETPQSQVEIMENYNVPHSIKIDNGSVKKEQAKGNGSRMSTLEIQSTII